MEIREEIDDFPDHKFDLQWQQKCWDILYVLYFDSEAGIFIQEINDKIWDPEMFKMYQAQISNPINLPNIKEKMINRVYE